MPPMSPVSLSFPALGLCLVAIICPALAQTISTLDLPAMRIIKSQWEASLDLSSWNESNPCSSWLYVFCSGNRVVKFDISRKGVSAPFPYAIANMTKVYQLYMDGNNFHGTLPDNFTLLSTLQLLRLGGSQMSGSLPSSWGSIKSLYKLYLNNNKLEGTIPDTWSGFNLGEMNIASNNLSGSIPTVICKWNNLLTLRMGGNPWTGSVPGCFGALTQLTHLYIDNSLTVSGTIPSEIGKMKALQNLFLNGNQITGPIPCSVGQMTNLQVLFLSGNQLTGPLPVTMGNCVSITDWVMEFNNIAGFIPPSIGGMAKCSRILLDNNMLSGSLPGSMGRLTDLKWLLLEGNKFVGSVPATLAKLPNLFYMDLANNRFVGFTPTGFVNPAIVGGEINMRSNYLSGAPVFRLANGTAFCPSTKTTNGQLFLSSQQYNCFTSPSDLGCTHPDPELTRNFGADCNPFCNSNNPLGACGGHGHCALTLAGTPSCVCYPGYTPTTNGQSCVPLP